MNEPATRFRVLAADPIEVDFANVLYQAIEESPNAIVALYSRSVTEVIKQFENCSRRGGRSIYRWAPDKGLISLREDAVTVPATRRIAEALRHIQQNQHFAVYLLPLMGQQLTPPNVAQLRQISRAVQTAMKRVVLLTEDGSLPATLSDYCAHLQLQPRSTAHLRMRDGRWTR